MKGCGYIGLLSILLLLFVSCEKEKIDNGPKAYRIDLATYECRSDQPSFILDNGTCIYPEHPFPSLNEKPGTRFVVKYSYIDDWPESKGRAAMIHTYNRVAGDTIRRLSPFELSGTANDPFEFVSAWYSQGYINLRFTPEVNCVTDRFDMFAVRRFGDKDNILRLEVRYDRNAETGGFSSIGYASFYVAHLITEPINQIVIYIYSNNYGEGYVTINLRKIITGEKYGYKK